MNEILNKQQELNFRIKINSIIFLKDKLNKNKLDEGYIATGFLVNYKKSYYVFSCGHVIKKFKEDKDIACYLDISEKIKITLRDIDYIEYDTDILDVGYMRLKVEFEKYKLSLLSLYHEDFYFQDPEWGKDYIYLYGYPAEFLNFSNNNEKYESGALSLGLTYTGIHKNKIFWQFKYPYKQSEFSIPYPKGLSGCAIWKIEGNDYTMEDYTKAKVIAVGHTWETRKNLYYVTPIKYFFSLIDKQDS
ncbi:MAG TPA: hypothetical protein VIK14_12665 [Ignavibacteria bacterium]